MPYENQFKMLADGFSNTSADFAAWAEAMDVRATIVGGQPFHGHGAQHVPPPPRNVANYRPLPQSLHNAASLLADIADCQEGMINHVLAAFGVALPPKPNTAENTIGRVLTESEILQLILNWQELDMGTFKTMMRLYGVTPEDHPARRSPGATSDQRLAEEIVSWLTVIRTDVNYFLVQQKLQKGGPNVPTGLNSVHDALADIEQQYHRLVNNYLALLNLLPYHLKRANP
jgi:hypothetical protein